MFEILNKIPDKFGNSTIWEFFYKICVNTLMQFQKILLKSRPEKHLDRFMSERLFDVIATITMSPPAVSCGVGFLARRNNQNKRTFNAPLAPQSHSGARCTHNNLNPRESHLFRKKIEFGEHCVLRVQIRIENSAEANEILSKQSIGIFLAVTF